MAQISQIQMRYVPEEDRILLRLNTSDRAEYRFWLTYRYTRQLWGSLTQLMAEDPQLRAASDPLAKQTILAFQHEQALRQVNFSRPFEEGPVQAPLGESPLLLFRLQTRTTPEGRPVLGLQPLRGQGVELYLSPVLLHAFARLLSETAAKAGWGLGVSPHLGLPARQPQPLSVN